jgi:protein phosphatase
LFRDRFKPLDRLLIGHGKWKDWRREMSIESAGASPENVEPAAPAEHEPREARVLRFATQTDVGTERPHNEDACGAHVEGAEHLIIAVADGVSGQEGGEVASQTAIHTLLRTYRDSPAKWGASKRLYRAAQQANIEVYDRAIVVTELRGMATTLTALVIDGAEAEAVHVGDSRLYLVRGGKIEQKSKDHTVAAGRQRIGLVSAEGAKDHPGRSILTRSLGKELIAQLDRFSFAIEPGDVLLLCSDGLYNVLSEDEMRDLVTSGDPATACAALVQAANARGTPDNLTAAAVQVVGGAPSEAPAGWRGFVAKVLGR